MFDGTDSENKSMNDRDLMDLAAKAAGMVFLTNGQTYHPEEGNIDWNPLADDGDALRLAVKLRMHIEPARTMGGDFVEVHAHPSGRGDCTGIAALGGDDNAATRRAIVIAAAELGKAQ